MSKLIPVREEVAQLKQEFSVLKEQNSQALEMLTLISQSMNKAANNPVQISKRLETEEAQIGHERPRMMKADGPAEESLEPRFIEGTEGMSMSKIEELIFMEQEIVVRVADTTNPADVQVPVVTNDGRDWYFVRNQNMKVKRKFVEVLGRAKKTIYSQRKTKDANGNDTFVNIPHTALAFPFAVISDPAGQKGREWFEKLMMSN